MSTMTLIANDNTRREVSLADALESIEFAIATITHGMAAEVNARDFVTLRHLNMACATRDRIKAMMAEGVA